MRIVIRVLINAVALWAAASVIDGIELSSELTSILIVAFVFGIINAVLRPIVKLLSLPFIVLTLGLFTFVVNGAMLLVVDWLTEGLDVDGFVNAMLGAIVISIVSWALSLFLPDGD